MLFLCLPECLNIVLDTEPILMGFALGRCCRFLAVLFQSLGTHLDLDRNPHVQMKFSGDILTLEASISGHKININFNIVMLASFSCFKMLTEAILKLKKKKKKRYRYTQ